MFDFDAEALVSRRVPDRELAAQRLEVIATEGLRRLWQLEAVWAQGQSRARAAVSFVQPRPAQKPVA